MWWRSCTSLSSIGFYTKFTWYSTWINIMDWSIWSLNKVCFVIIIMLIEKSLLLSLLDKNYVGCFVRNVITRNDVIICNDDDERTEENELVFINRLVPSFRLLLNESKNTFQGIIEMREWPFFDLNFCMVFFSCQSELVLNI